jgi:hypothetical protein
MTKSRAVIFIALCSFGYSFATQAIFAQAQTVERPKEDVSKLQTIPWTEVIANLEQVQGFYTYKAAQASVEILGYKIVQPVNITLASGMVDFKLCNGHEMPVDPNALKETSRRCPGDSGIWLRKYGNALVPASNDSGLPKDFAGKKIDLSSFPQDYQDILAGAKNGDLVGYSSPSAAGGLSLSVVTKGIM